MTELDRQTAKSHLNAAMSQMVLAESCGSRHMAEAERLMRKVEEVTARAELP